MCTIQDEKTVYACDCIMPKMGPRLQTAFGDQIQISDAGTRGTLIQASPILDLQEFTRIVQAVIAEGPDE